MRSAFVITTLGIMLLTTAHGEQDESALTSRIGGIQPINDANHQWSQLLPDEGLDGWVVVGGTAKIEREGDEVHGYQAGRTNTFLFSEKQYGDFILEGEVKIEAGGNSGWQVRCHQVDPTNIKSTVRGYQIEIDSSPRSWSGGLYDEARRGWIHPLKDDTRAQSAFQVGKWNHFRIEMNKGHIRSWVNGIPCADVLDFADLQGSIAFQVHSGACDVRWKNLKIIDLGVSTLDSHDQTWNIDQINFIQRSDQLIQGNSINTPVIAKTNLPQTQDKNGHPGITIQLGFELQGEAKIHLGSKTDTASDGFVIHLDSKNKDRHGVISGIKTHKNMYPIVTEGAGVPNNHSLSDLIIDVELNRITILSDGKVINRVYADEPIHIDTLEVSLPTSPQPGDNSILLTQPKFLSH